MDDLVFVATARDVEPAQLVGDILSGECGAHSFLCALVLVGSRTAPRLSGATSGDVRLRA